MTGGESVLACPSAIRPETVEGRKGRGRTGLGAPIAKAASECGAGSFWLYLFFSLPRGITEVTGGMGRSEGLPLFLGAEVSFLGFLDIFSLRCSLAINPPLDG